MIRPPKNNRFILKCLLNVPQDSQKKLLFHSKIANKLN